MHRRNSLYYIYVDVTLVTTATWKSEVNSFKSTALNPSKINSKITKKLTHASKLQLNVVRYTAKTQTYIQNCHQTYQAVHVHDKNDMACIKLVVGHV